MATYTNTTLQHGETIVRIGHLSWVIYAKTLAYAALAAVVSTVAYAMIGFNRVTLTVGFALIAIAVRHALKAWWHRYTIEIAVTNRRVIFKRGFIWRRTNEMFLSKIESVFVDQSFLGRIFNFGSIHCRGTGEGMEHLHYVADPVAIQNAINAK
jgi:uncharacterized membrane protein YdbT with pleckstrin-like domain